MNIKRGHFRKDISISEHFLLTSSENAHVKVTLKWVHPVNDFSLENLVQFLRTLQKTYLVQIIKDNFKTLKQLTLSFNLSLTSQINYTTLINKMNCEIFKLTL